MFSKTFVFNIKDKEVRVENNWFRGLKLYVDGDFKDKDTRLFAFDNAVALSANLGNGEILEITPISGAFTVEMDAYLKTSDTRELVYSSYQRVSLKAQRLIQS